MSCVFIIFPSLQSFMKIFSTNHYCHLIGHNWLNSGCPEVPEWELMKLSGSSLGLLNSLSGRKRGQFF